MFFLKRGYPIRLFRDASSSDDLYKTIVYNQEDLYRQGSLTKISEPEVDHCWACLTCLCGKDEEELEENVAKAVNKHLVDEEELEALFPKNYLKGILKNTIESSKERLKDPSMVYSTKSLILRNMTKIDRNLGDEYSLLKSKKNRKIVLEMWHEIFNFISNDDDPPKKVIFNDFLIFCRASELGLSDHSVNTVYRKISNASWNEYISMDISEFALAVEALASEVYSTKYSESLNSSTLLVERVYYNLCQYSEFQDILHSKQFKQKESNFGNSPFENNYANYQEFSEKFREKD